MSSFGPRGAVAPSGRTTPPAPRLWWRRQLGLLLGIAAGLVVCAVVFVVANAITGRRMPPPAPAAQAICADLEHQDYSDLFSRLAPPQRAAGSEQQFEASQRELDRLRGPVTSCGYALLSVSANAATTRLTIARGTEAPTQAEVELGAENGVWQIESYDTSVV